MTSTVTNILHTLSPLPFEVGTIILTLQKISLPMLGRVVGTGSQVYDFILCVF